MVGVSKAVLEQKCGLSRKGKPEPEGAGLLPATSVLMTQRRGSGFVETRNMKVRTVFGRTFS